MFTNEDSMIEQYFDAIKEWFDIIPRDGKLYELVPHGYSKGSANDITMFKVSPNAINE